MARKSKVQTTVENFESQFEDLVKEWLSDIDLEKAEDCFTSSDLFYAVQDVLDSGNEDEDDEDEDDEDEDD